MPASGEASPNNSQPMQLTITLPDRESSLAFHQNRWAEVVGDRWLAEYQGRLETNAQGQIIMSPPAAFVHSRRQSRIAVLLEQYLGEFSVTECGVITSDGVKVVDVGWYSRSRMEEMNDEIVAELPPEICVEVLSLSNTVSEMEFKRALYLEAGAIECWQCDLQGQMSYYHPDEPNAPQTNSTLCPNFPTKISD